jgi:hypothetical protein
MHIIFTSRHWSGRNFPGTGYLVLLAFIEGDILCFLLQIFFGLAVKEYDPHPLTVAGFSISNGRTSTMTP